MTPPTIHQGPWTIYYEPPPIPTREWDWHYYHRDFDGEGDPRHGSAASPEACLAEIAELEAGGEA